MTGLSFLKALSGALILGAANTLGDLVWRTLDLRHEVSSGILHGGLLFLVMGLVLSLMGSDKRVWLGGGLGMMAGALGALVYYLLRFVSGPEISMVTAWVFVWTWFTILRGPLLGEFERPIAILVRSLVASTGSGVCFYWAVSLTWLTQQPQEPNTLLLLFYWTVAFLPGFLVLLWKPGEVSQ